MKRLAIVGSGDLGQQIAHHALSDNHYNPVGFFDDFHEKGSVKYNLPILGNFEDILLLYNEGVFDLIMIGVGYKHFNLREILFKRFENIIPFGSILHSSCYIDRSCKIGVGVFIYPGCILDMNVELSDNVLVNVGCVIGHDSHIGSHSFLSPGVKIAGFVKVSEKVSIGINATLIDNLIIESGVRIGGGTVVTKNLSKPGLYVGVPAVFKKQ